MSSCLLPITDGLSYQTCYYWPQGYESFLALADNFIFFNTVIAKQGISFLTHCDLKRLQFSIVYRTLKTKISEGVNLQYTRNNKAKQNEVKKKISLIHLVYIPPFLKPAYIKSLLHFIPAKPTL